MKKLTCRQYAVAFNAVVDRRAGHMLNAEECRKNGQEDTAKLFDAMAADCAQTMAALNDLELDWQTR